jgi:hypothetical protein
MQNDVGLTELEKAVLAHMINKRPADRDVFLKQLDNCQVVSRENTGCGFYTALRVDRHIAPSEFKERELIQGVHVSCPELQHGAGFILYIQNGYLHSLEGYTFVDEQWPEKISSFQVSSSEASDKRDQS